MRRNMKTQIQPWEADCQKPLVLFDGECNLCESSLQFLIKHNHSGNLSFATLQSAKESEVLKHAGLPVSEYDSLLLWEDNKLYSYSTAVLKISKHLDFPWNMIRMLLFVPATIRDPIYRFLAKRRYKWFGKKSLCTIPTPFYTERFQS